MRVFLLVGGLQWNASIPINLGTEAAMDQTLPILCQFSLRGVRPVPWSVPRSHARGRKGAYGYRPPIPNKRFKAWQDWVQLAAFRAMAGKPIHAEGVMLGFRFRIMPVGKRQLPDLRNLQKGTEDALQGIVFTNDTLVRADAPHYLDLVDSPEAEGVDVVVMASAPIQWIAKMGATEVDYYDAVKAMSQDDWSGSVCRAELLVKPTPKAKSPAKPKRKK